MDPGRVHCSSQSTRDWVMRRGIAGISDIGAKNPPPGLCIDLEIGDTELTLLPWSSLLKQRKYNLWNWKFTWTFLVGCPFAVCVCFSPKYLHSNRLVYLILLKTIGLSICAYIFYRNKIEVKTLVKCCALLWDFDYWFLSAWDSSSGTGGQHTCWSEVVTYSSQMSKLVLWGGLRTKTLGCGFNYRVYLANPITAERGKYMRGWVRSVSFMHLCHLSLNPGLLMGTEAFMCRSFILIWGWEFMCI